MEFPLLDDFIFGFFITLTTDKMQNMCVCVCVCVCVKDFFNSMWIFIEIFSWSIQENKNEFLQHSC